MAQPVQSSPLLPPRVVPPPPSKRQLAEWIKGLNAESIKMLSLKIGGAIVKHIGKDPKLKIELFVQLAKTQRKSKKTHFLEEQIIASPLIKGLGKEVKFIDHITPFIQQKITEDFATASLFLEYGTPFSLSDEEPCGILLDAAEKIGLSITQNEVPKNYRIKLAMNFEESNDSGFVLSLSETCDGVEFQRELLYFNMKHGSDSEEA